MADWLVTTLSIGGSAIASFIASFIGSTWGSYRASKDATHQAEEERNFPSLGT